MSVPHAVTRLLPLVHTQTIPYWPWCAISLAAVMSLSSAGRQVSPCRQAFEFAWIMPLTIIVPGLVHGEPGQRAIPPESPLLVTGHSVC